MSEYSVNIKIDGNSTGATTAIDSVTEKLEGLDKEYKNTGTTSEKTTEKVNGGLKDWGINLDKLYEKGNSFFKSWGIDVDKLAGKFGMSGKMLTGIIGVGTIVAQVGAKIVAQVSEWTDAFGNYEEKTKEVFTLLPDITEDAMEDMMDEVDKFSKDFGVLPEKTIPALYQAISAGVPSENVFAFLETAQKAAKGGVASLTSAVDVLSSITNAYGQDVISTAEASDALFMAVKDGKTTFDELSSSLFNVVPTAASLGVNFDEVAAGLAAITAQGTPTSVATTQMRQLFVELSKEGSKTAGIFESLAGKSFAQFIKEGGTLNEALGLMYEESERLDFGVNNLFSSVEAGNAALQLTGKGAEKFSDTLQDMENKTGATDKAFGLMSNTFNQTKAEFAAASAVLSKSLGEMFAPLASGIVEAGTSIVNILQDLVDFISPIVEPIMGIIGTVISEVFRLLSGLMSEITRFLDNWLIVWDQAGNILNSAWDLIGAVLGNAVDIIILAVDLINSALEGDWKRAWLAAQLIVLKAVDAVLAAASFMVNGVIGIINGMLGPINIVAGVFGKHIDEIAEVSFSNMTGLTGKIEKLTEEMNDTSRKESKITKTDLTADQKAITLAAETSAASQIEWSAKLRDQKIKDLQSQREKEIQAARDREADAEDLVAIAKSYDDKILELTKQRLNQERTDAIAAEKQKGEEKKLTAEQVNASLLLINQFYDKEILTAEEDLAKERVKIAEDFADSVKKEEEGAAKEAKKLAEDRYKFESEWSKKTANNKLADIELARGEALAEAESLKASAKTVYEINKYYDDLRVQSYVSSVDAISGYVVQIGDAIGGEGAGIVSKITGVVTDVVKAVASGGADIASIISAVVGIIGLAGEANAEKMEGIQEKFAEFGQELLTVLAPVLEFVLDVLEMIFPVLELFIPLLKYILGPLEIILAVLTPMMELWLMFNPVIILLKLLNPLLEIVVKWLGEVADALKIAGDMATDFVESGFSEMANLLIPLSQALTDFGNSVRVGAADGMEKFKIKVQEGIAAIKTFTSDLSSQGKVAIQSFINGLKTGDIWSGISSSFSTFQTKITTGFTTIKNGIVSAFSGIGSVLKAPINAVIAAFNTVINAMNTIRVTIPWWVPGIGGNFFGVNLASIPMLAKGAESFEGGLALVGEQGPEFRYLEKGTQITPAGKTQSLLENSGKKEYTITANFNSPKAMNQKEQMYAVKKWGEDLAFQGVI